MASGSLGERTLAMSLKAVEVERAGGALRGRTAAAAAMVMGMLVVRKVVKRMVAGFGVVGGGWFDCFVLWVCRVGGVRCVWMEIGGFASERKSSFLYSGGVVGKYSQMLVSEARWCV